MDANVELDHLNEVQRAIEDAERAIARGRARVSKLQAQGVDTELVVRSLEAMGEILLTLEGLRAKILQTIDDIGAGKYGPH